MLRKVYDYLQIELTRWNKGNMIYYIDCMCGNLAKRGIRKSQEVICPSCGRTYIKMFSGNYVEKE